MPSSNDSDSDPAVRSYRPAASRADAAPAVVAVAETIVRFNPKAAVPKDGPAETALPVVREIGGRKNGIEPTRFGDWEKDGRCIDF